MISGVAGRVRTWIAARRNDPVPILLTVAGCILSIAALVLGLNVDARGVASNILGDLVVVGPALFLSNIVVKRVQEARARQRIAPLIHVVAQLLRTATQTGRQALDMFDAAAGEDTSTRNRGDDYVTVAAVDAALAEIAHQLDIAMQERPLPPVFAIIEPLRFPRFVTIGLLLQQASQDHPMPWTIAAANIAQDWAQRCGVDFLHYRDDGQPVHRRYVGLVEIEEQSKAAGAATRVDAVTYLQTVRGCLHGAHGISRRLAQEAPPELVSRPLPNPIEVDIEGLQATTTT
jgi:hypothetical protein